MWIFSFKQNFTSNVDRINSGQRKFLVKTTYLLTRSKRKYTLWGKLDEGEIKPFFKSFRYYTSTLLVSRDLFLTTLLSLKILVHLDPHFLLFTLFFYCIGICIFIFIPTSVLFSPELGWRNIFSFIPSQSLFKTTWHSILYNVHFIHSFL